MIANLRFVLIMNWTELNCRPAPFTTTPQSSVDLLQALRRLLKRKTCLGTRAFLWFALTRYSITNSMIEVLENARPAYLVSSFDCLISSSRDFPPQFLRHHNPPAYLVAFWGTGFVYQKCTMVRKSSTVVVVKLEKKKWSTVCSLFPF